MKSKTLIAVLALSILLLVGISLTSAALCKNSKGYYEQCSSYKSSYGDYNIANKASTPIFKGPYGNYRYKMYEQGDYRPARYFQSYGYGGYGYRPFFGSGYYGGYYGGYGYGGYSGWGLWSWFW